MQERRRLPNDWVKKLKAANIKAEELREAFPSNHQEQIIAQLKDYIQEKGENFLYKDAKHVFTTLIEKTEEGKQKSFLGYYKSQLVKDWQLLLRIYESDNLFLAEYGKIVQQVKGFDLPSMKKQLQSISKQIQESQQKIKDLKRSSIEQEKKFNEDCGKLGILPTTQQADLEKQVLTLVQQLPKRFQKLEESLKSKVISNIIQYYHEFNRYLEQDQVLKTLEYANKYGDENLKLYEWRKENPNLDQVPQYLFEKEKHKYALYSRFDAIVNGEDDVKPADIAASGSIDIDWSQIDDIITLEGSGETSNQWTMVDDPVDKAEAFEVKEDLSKYNQEETIFFNQETRQLLANDLEECEFFMRQRLAELSSKDQATFSMYSESVERKEILKLCDQDSFLKEGLQAIKEIKHELNDKDVMQLIVIRQKPKIAVQRIIQRIQVPLKLKEKQGQTVINLEKKLKEMQNEIEPLKKQIDSNEKLIKELIEVIEKELSLKLKAQTSRIIEKNSASSRFQSRRITYNTELSNSTFKKSLGSPESLRSYLTPNSNLKNLKSKISTEKQTSLCHTQSLAISTVSKDHPLYTGTTEDSDRKKNIIQKKKQQKLKLKFSETQKPKMRFPQTLYAQTSRTKSLTPLRVKDKQDSKKEMSVSITYDSDAMNEIELDELVIQEVVDKTKSKNRAVGHFKIGSLFNRTKSLQIAMPKYGSQTARPSQAQKYKEDTQMKKIDQNIDMAIETVALKVNQKEQLFEQGLYLKDQLYELKQENEIMAKEKTKIESFISKYERQEGKLLVENIEIQKEINKYRNSINHYKTQVQLDLDCQEKQKEEKRLKLELEFKQFQQELTQVIQELKNEQDFIGDLTKQFSILEQTRFELIKQINQAVKMENQRVKLMKTKSKVLESVISEERLTKKYGDRASNSPIGRRVQTLVKGRKYY